MNDLSLFYLKATRVWDNCMFQISSLQGPEYLENIFSRFLIKTTHQRKLRQTKCLLFNFWMIKSSKAWILPNGLFGITANFIVQKLKSKHLDCLSFLRWVFFLGNERKYFPNIPGLSLLSLYLLQIDSKFNRNVNSTIKVTLGNRVEVSAVTSFLRCCPDCRLTYM